MIDPIALITGALAVGAAAGAAGARWQKAKPEAEALAINTLRGVLAELRAELEAKGRIVTAQALEIRDLRHRVHIAELAVEHIAGEGEEGD